MSKYDTYKETDVIWFKELPAHWKRKRVKDVTQTLAGGTPDTSKEEYWEGSIPWLPSGKVQNSIINEEDADTFITEEGLKNSATKMLPAPATLIALTGATCSNIGYLTFDACANQSVVGMPGSSKILPKFLFYTLQSQKEQILLHQTGGAQGGISESDVKFLFIPVPIESEQLTIANYLDDQTQKIDRLIANKKAQAEKLKELRQIEINNAVTKGLNPNAEMKDSGIEWLGKIPQHWEVKKVKQLLKPEKNAIKTGPFGSDLKFEDLVEQGVKVYNQRSVLDNDWVSGEGYITDEKYRSLETCTIYPGDIVITTRGTIGKASIFPDNAELGILHPCLMRVQMNNYRVLNDFLKIIINESGYFLEALKLASNATTIDVVYSDNLKEVKIAVPPTTEQKEIIAFVVKRTIAIDQLIKNIELQIEKLQELRKIKIYEAVTGKIKVNAYAETTA